ATTRTWALESPLRRVDLLGVGIAVARGVWPLLAELRVGGEAEATGPRQLRRHHQYSRATPADGPTDGAPAIELPPSMLEAARSGDSAPLLALIDQGAPVNLRDSSGNSPLMLAAYHGHAELVRELAARGADVDLANDRGESPLAGVAFKGYTEVAEVLLEAGADPDAGTPSARETARYFEREEISALMG